MAVDTSTVQIRIDVVDQNSASTVKNVEQNIQGLGNAGATTGDKVAAGMDKIHGHSLTALDNVRLLRDDIGIRIPRSMEKAIASSKFLMAGIGAIGTGLLAIGAVDIGIRIGKGLYDAYEKWISLGAAAKAYEEQIKKAKDEDFINVHNIETATARIKEATSAAQGYMSAAQMGNKLGWGLTAIADPMTSMIGIATLYNSRKAADESYKKRSQADALRGPQAAEQHQAILSGIELSHAGDQRLRGEQKITAEKEKQHAINEENRKYEVGVEGLKGNPVPADAGKSKQHQLDAIADAKADAETFNLRREQGIELQHMQEAAREAGLRGVALYEAQEAAAIAELKNKDMDSVAARAAVHAKFHAEELRRLQDETRETEKIERLAAAAGTSGIAKIQAEGANRVADINADETLNPENRARRIAAANLEMHGQMTAAELEFTERVNALADESAAHQISGFGRIRAEAQKQIDELQRDYEKLYGANRNAPEYQAHQGELNRGIGVINAGAGQQTADLTRKNAEETSQLESEARSKMLSAERQQTAAIETEYEQRLRKFEEQLQQQEISEDDYNRRVVAAAELRDAEMVENARRAREKMAGEFTSFFHSLDHPTEALKNIGDKVAGQAAAALMQRAQNHFSGNGAASRTTNPGDFMNGIFDRIAGKPHGAGAPPPLHTGGDLAAVKSISMSSAEIHVQSANLNLGASGTAPGSGAGAPASATGYKAAGAITPYSSAGGSTPLLPGGSSDLPDVGQSVLGGHGGAGDSGVSSTSSAASSFGSAGSTVAGGGAAITNGIGDVQKGMSLFSQAKGIFAPGNASANGGSTATGNLTDLGGTNGPDLASIFGSSKPNVTGPTNGGMLGGGGIGANLGGAAGGALGLYSAYQGNGGIGGTLSGAMSGMEFGMAVGGPVGAAVGAAAGAVLGAIGFGGREKARVYDLKTVRPRIGSDTMAYQAGSMDYTAAYSDLQSLDAEARKTLDAMGGSARAYYWDTINKEIHQAEAKLTAEQKAGRSQVTMSGAQFDQGGWTGNFGSMATGPDSGWAHMRSNEFVVNEQPAAAHSGALEAIRSGASHEDMARYYGGDQRTMPAQAASMGDVHLHVHAIDAKSSIQFLNANKHNIRAALNDSYAENSGGADA